MGLVGAFAFAGRFLVLIGDLQRQLHVDFVDQLERAHRVAGLSGGLLDGVGVLAFPDHGDGFVDEGADHAAGEEAAGIVDHDRRLLDLQGVVEHLGEHFITGVFTTDDFHQRHFFHRAEEVDADEVFLLLHAFGEAGDRQRGGVGTQYRIGFDHVFHFLEHLVLELGVLEHGLDDEVHAFQVRRIGGGGDARENFFFLLFAHLALGHFLVEQLGGIRLALLGVLGGNILEHHLGAGARGDVGDARAHHARAQHRHFFGLELGHVVGTAGAGVDRLQVKEEGGDHVLGNLAAGQFHEVTAFDGEGVVEAHLGAFHGGRHDVARCRVVGAFQLLAQVGRERRQVLRHGRGAGGAAGNLVAFFVPGLLGLGVGFDPLAGLGQHLFLAVHHLVDDAHGFGFFHFQPLALHQHLHQGVLDAQHAHAAHHAAGAGQQAQADFREAELRFRIVQRDTTVAGQRDFQTAAQGGAVERRDHGFAQGFQAAQLRLAGFHALGEFGGVFRGHFDQVIEVAAGEEGAFRGGDDDAGDLVFFFLQTGDHLFHGTHVALVHGVGGLLGIVQDQGNDVIRVLFPADG